MQVEIEYFITLSEFLPQLRALATGENKEALRKIYREFSVEDATRIKEIESVTNHDVKAVEYFIKEKFDLLSLQEYKEFIHFGLTSQDINNTSVPLSIKDALNEVYLQLSQSTIFLEFFQTFVYKFLKVFLIRSEEHTSELQSRI